MTEMADKKIQLENEFYRTNENSAKFYTLMLMKESAQAHAARYISNKEDQKKFVDKVVDKGLDVMAKGVVLRIQPKESVLEQETEVER